MTSLRHDNLQFPKEKNQWFQVKHNTLIVLVIKTGLNEVSSFFMKKLLVL